MEVKKLNIKITQIGNELNSEEKKKNDFIFENLFTFI